MAADKFADAQKLLTRSGPFATADFDKDYPVRPYSHPLCAERGHLELTGTWNFAIGTRTTPAHHLERTAQHSNHTSLALCVCTAGESACLGGLHAQLLERTAPRRAAPGHAILCVEGEL